MSKTDLTAGALRELLHYNPESGIFTWLVAQGGASIGAVAGSPNERGYWKIKLCGRAYGAHRLAWLYCNGAWPSFEIDHHDQDKSNNRIANLRPATRSQNSQNKSLRCDNKSGLRGVSWYAKSGKWCAQIGLNGKRKNLGYFESKEDAYKAYLAAAATMHTHTTPWCLALLWPSPNRPRIPQGFDISCVAICLARQFLIASAAVSE